MGSRILQINVNELLSGERLPSQEYSKKAEENIISLMQESSENYKRDIREWFGFMLGVAVLAFVVWLGCDIVANSNLHAIKS